MISSEQKRENAWESIVDQLTDRQVELLQQIAACLAESCIDDPFGANDMLREFVVEDVPCSHVVSFVMLAAKEIGFRREQRRRGPAMPSEN